MVNQETISPNLTPSPDNLQGVPASFYTNISYGEFADNIFDIFIPDSASAESLAPLVVYIHGGGYLSGDKGSIYSKDWVIEPLLDLGIAFASINYRLLPTNDGVIDSLNDSMRALQFIRSQADEYNIDTNNIALYGDSAGASTSLWLALNDDMANPSSDDPVARESTRVQGVVANGTQSTLDLRQWETKVFPEWGDLTMENITNSSPLLTQMALVFYGINNVNEIDNVPYIDDINMLNLMDEDDPQLFISNTGHPYTNPIEFGYGYGFYSSYVHHPNHVRALQLEASLIDNYDILAKYQTEEGLFDNTQSQSVVDFLQSILVDAQPVITMIHITSDMVLNNLTLYYYKDGIDTGVSTLVENGETTFPDTSLDFDTVKLSNPSAYTDGIAADDAVDVLRYVVQLDLLTAGSLAWHSADVNNDGIITAGDAVDILRHVVQLDTLDTFDLIDNTTDNRITSLDANVIDVGQWSIVANGDVNQSGGFGDDYTVAVDIV